MKRKNSGVTLIALIITIIVLLILAGVTIAMIMGDNGMLNQATNSKIQTNHGTIKEGISLQYSDYEIDRKTETQEINSFWEFLLDSGIIDANGVINIEKLVGAELSTGKGNATDKKDVYILEEIENQYVLKYYDDNSNDEILWQINKDDVNLNVEVKIDRFPESETEETNFVALTLTSVLLDGKELKTKFNSVDEYLEIVYNKISEITSEEKVNILIDIMYMLEGTQYSEQDLIDDMYNSNIITEATKEALYDYLNTDDTKLDLAYYVVECNYNLIGEFNYNTLELYNYKVINPDNEYSNTYVATQNGEYTFKVVIYENGENYTFNKKVTVKNINNSIEKNDNYYIGNHLEITINLLDKTNDEPTSFSEIYIFYNNEWKNLSELIENHENYSYVEGVNIREYAKESNRRYFSFMCIKDNQLYIGEAKIEWEE